MQTQMDNPTSDSSAPHRTKDCIRNLKFVYTTNGGYDYHQARQTAPTGDCMVIAASVATGICYAEAERRLSLLAGSIAKCGDKLGALEVPKAETPRTGLTHSRKKFRYSNFPIVTANIAELMADYVITASSISNLLRLSVLCLGNRGATTSLGHFVCVVV